MNLIAQRMLLGAGGGGPTGSWVARETTNTGFLRRMTSDAAGNTYATSDTNPSIMKFSPDGVPLWELMISPAGGSALWAIAYSAVDDTIVTAFANYSGANMIMMKINPNGTVAWQRAIAGGSFETYPGGMTVDSSGSIYFGGTFYPASGSAMIIAKFNSTCTAVTWQRRWTNGASYGKGVAVDSTGAAYIIGVLNSVSVLYKVTSAGAYSIGMSGGTYNSAFHSLSIDSSNNIYTNIYKNGVTKYNSSLSLQWHSSTVEEDGNTGTSFNVCDPSGNTYEFSSPSGEATRIVARNTSGSVTWATSLSGRSLVNTPSLNEPRYGAWISGSNHIVTSLNLNRCLLRLPRSGGFTNGTYDGLTTATISTPGTGTQSTITTATQATATTAGFTTPTTSSITTSLVTSFTSSIVNIPVTA